jgi:hypothetical protein
MSPLPSTVPTVVATASYRARDVRFLGRLSCRAVSEEAGYRCLRLPERVHHGGAARRSGGSLRACLHPGVALGSTRRVDVGGALLLGGGLGAMLAYISLGREFGWLSVGVGV